MREEHRKSLAEVRDAAADAVNMLRAQLAEVGARIVEAQEHMAQPVAEVHALADQLIARVEHTMVPLGQRVADIEETLQDLRNRSAALQENLAADLNGIEQSLATHAAAIDSARTAMAQTDDLVERVVEALELLQSSVLDQHEERAALIE
jgi:predicted  nucleic acid-binding Zn-ribbon protein